MNNSEIQCDLFSEPMFIDINYQEKELNNKFNKLSQKYKFENYSLLK